MRFSSADLHSLTTASSMFFGCTSLADFSVTSGELPALTDGDSMFFNCESLSSLPSVEMPKLQYGSSMFRQTALTEIDGVSFPALTDGTSMFADDKELTRVNELSCP